MLCFTSVRDTNPKNPSCPREDRGTTGIMFQQPLMPESIPWEQQESRLIRVYQATIWLFNIATENHHF